MSQRLIAFTNFFFSEFVKLFGRRKIISTMMFNWSIFLSFILFVSFTIKSVFPLQNGLILSTCCHNVLLSLTVLWELNICNLAAVTIIFCMVRTKSWVPEKLYKPEIICRCQNISIWSTINGVYIFARSTTRVNSTNLPSFSASPAMPNLILPFVCTCFIILKCSHVEPIIVRLEHHWINWEVHVPNCLGTSLQFLFRLELIQNVVSHNCLVLTSDCTNFIIRWKLNACYWSSISVLSFSYREKIGFLI